MMEKERGGMVRVFFLRVVLLLFLFLPTPIFRPLLPRIHFPTPTSLHFELFRNFGTPALSTRSTRLAPN